MNASTPISASRRWISGYLAAWDRFWFAPRLPHTLAVLRIRPGEEQSIDEIDPAGGLRIDLLEPASEVTTLPDDEAAMEERQRLLGGDGDATPWRQLRRVGTIEDFHERIGKCSEHESIDATPEVLRSVGIEAEVVHVRRDVDARR